MILPKRIVGVGQRQEDPSNKEALATAVLWGTNPVHPTGAAYRVIADHIQKDLANGEAKYTNPPKRNISLKRNHPDLTRREPFNPTSKRGRGEGHKHPGYRRGRGPAGS